MSLNTTMKERFITPPVGELTIEELNSRICNSDLTSMYVHVALCVIGMILSGTNAIVLTRKSMNIFPLNILLAGLQCTNVVLLTIHLPSLVFKIVCPVYLFKSWVVILFSTLANMPRPLVIYTNWMACCVGAWKFAAVKWPLKTRTLLTRKLALFLIPSIGVFAAILSVYLFFGLETDKMDVTIYDPHLNNTYIITMYNRTTDSLASMHFYEFNRPAFIIIHILGYLVPCIISVVANLGLITMVFAHATRRRHLVEGQNASKGSGETRMTIFLSILLLSNVFCYVTPGLFILAKALCTTDCGPSMPGHWSKIFSNYRAVLVLNCLEFFGYYLMSENFRRTFRSLLGEAASKRGSQSYDSKRSLCKTNRRTFGGSSL